MIRLKDPWAGSQEWKGGCSDYDTSFWTEAIKSAFNTRNKLDQDDDEEVEPESSQRFVHSWNNTNDGVFAMRLSDFMKHFNHLTICRKTDDTWLEAKYM